MGYSEADIAGQAPMRAVALAATDKRVGILIHPAHPPKLFLSSVGCLNPTSPLVPEQNIDFFDSRRRVIALIESLRAFAPRAFEHEVSSRIEGANVLVEGEPENVISGRPLEVAVAAAATEPTSLPISRRSAEQATAWLMQNFGEQMSQAVNGKPYGVEHLRGIVCQETAYKWVPWIDTMPPATIVARAVFDASGDYPGTSRNAFPVNTAAFRSMVNR